MVDLSADRAVRRMVFDKDGDVGQQTMADLVEGASGDAFTDLVMFSHGWNNDEAAAQSLYDRWFALLGAHLGPRRNVGLVGIRWPAQLWRDEPIPDFDPFPLLVGAGLEERAPPGSASPALGPVTLSDLEYAFPAGAQ